MMKNPQSKTASPRPGTVIPAYPFLDVPVLRSLAFAGSLAMAAVLLIAPSNAQAQALKTRDTTPAPTPASATAPAATDASPDRSSAYYHFGLAHMYEDMAASTGRQDYATRAIEEYKLALNADPTSPYLNKGLAQLYFTTGRVKDAILSAQQMIQKNPNDLDAHKLLGRIYLRSLGETQNAESQKMLDLSIGEFSKITELQPNDIESHLLLGQLYTLNHDSARARQQFEDAQKIDPNNEDVALNLSRLYAEQGDMKRSVEILKVVPPEDRTAKIDFALGVSYDQLKDQKHAIEAYQDAVDQEPDNLDAQRALALALLGNNQLAPALKIFQDLAVASPQDAQAYIKISEIQRRQGNYQEALTTLRKARTLAPADSQLEIDFNESLIQDSLGHYDEAVGLLKKLLTQTEKANGQYTDGEKNNRLLFLDRLANLYREQNHTAEAIATYQKMIALGGENIERGYLGEVDAYRDARQYDKATEAAQEAAAKLPKNQAIQLMLAGQLADTGKAEEGLKLAKAQLNGSPSDHEVELALAQIYTRLRRWKDASDQLDLAEKTSPRSEDKVYLDFLRGALEERQKHYDSAEASFRKVLEIDPNNSQTLNYLGYMLADRGVQLDDALHMIQKAVELDPQNYAYLDSLGWAYFKLGQYTLAEDNLRRASERMGTDPTVHDHLGELYEKTGRLKQAAAQWEISLGEYEKTAPGDSEPGDVNKVQKKLELAKVRLAKGGTATTKE
jgi:tetratricopeptide (TPR) repeat protein